MRESNNISRYCLLLITVVLVFLYPSQGLAGWSTPFKWFAKLVKHSPSPSTVRKLGKVANALTDVEIDDLAKLARRAGGLDEIGQMLGKRKLVNEVLEDTYVRIAIKNNKITKETGETIFKNLSGVDGFRSTMRKINSISSAQTKGHLREVMVASSAKSRGFKVLGIGKKFDDGLKRGLTDIDIVLQKGKKTFAIESKSYVSDVPMDMLRKDADTLLRYKDGSKDIIPVFVFDRAPSEYALKVLKTKGVEVLYGSQDEVVISLEQLGSIL